MVENEDGRHNDKIIATTVGFGASLGAFTSGPAGALTGMIIGLASGIAIRMTDQSGPEQKPNVKQGF
jgi:hypothetical protein